MDGNFMTAQEIYENFVNGEGPGSLIESAMQISQVEATYNARAKQIETLAASMEEGWTGDASGAAQRGAGPLAVEHAGAAEAMSTAKQLLTDQATEWSDTKARVQPVPPVPEAPSTFKQLITFGGANRDYENQVRQSNEAAQSNVAAMGTWTATSDTNGRTMPTAYGQIDPNALDVSMTQPETPPSIHGRSTGTDTGHRTAGDDRGTSTTPGTTTPGTTTSGTTPGTTTPGTDQPGTTTQPPGDTTGTAGYVPPSARPGGAGFPGVGGPGGASGDGSGGIGDGFVPGGFGAGGGSATDEGRLGGGTGTGSGSRAGGGSQAGARLGGGSGSGSGGQGEAMGRAASATRGTTGRPGAPGMGGLPQGKGGGKTEDEEHQRKYVLDDDELFQLGDDGERVTDPRTGLPPVPPVIGEK